MDILQLIVVYHGAKNSLPDTGGYIVDKIYKMPQESPEVAKTRIIQMMRFPQSISDITPIRWPLR